jgi:cytochrome c-type biogenesis protein
MDSSQLNLPLAFVAGVATFFTPCFLPLLPAYLSFISGVSFSELSRSDKPKRAVVINSLFFILGFSIVFVLLGASITYLGRRLQDYQAWVRTGGGIIVIAFGLYMLFGMKLSFLEKERRVQLRSRPAGYLGSMLVGVAFAAGWTPCVGPILGSILVYASASETMGEGVRLLVAYSLGLGVPFLLSAILANEILKRMTKLTKYIRPVSVVCGLILVVMGIFLIADPFHLLRAM